MFVNEKGEQVFTAITNSGPIYVYVKDGKIHHVLIVKVVEPNQIQVLAMVF